MRGIGLVYEYRLLGFLSGLVLFFGLLFPSFWGRIQQRLFFFFFYSGPSFIPYLFVYSLRYPEPGVSKGETITGFIPSALISFQHHLYSTWSFPGLTLSIDSPFLHYFPKVLQVSRCLS